MSALLWDRCRSRALLRLAAVLCCILAPMTAAWSQTAPPPRPPKPVEPTRQTPPVPPGAPAPPQHLLEPAPRTAPKPTVPPEVAALQPSLALDARGHTAAVYKLNVSRYGELITVGLDKTIRIWDLETGEPKRILRPPIDTGAHGYCFASALSPDGRLLAVAGYRALTPLYDHRIHLIELPEGKLVRSLKGHVYGVYDLAFSSDGKLASVSHDRTCRIWDPETGQEVRALEGHTGPVHSVAWSPDGKRLVTGSLDKTARIWSADSGQALATMQEGRHYVMTVAWSPDGRTVAAGCNDKSIRLYEPSGKLRYTWSKLPNEVASVTFSPDSLRLLYTYGSNTVPPVGTAILDMVKGQELTHYRGHENSVLCGVFAPDGLSVITGDSISRIRVWDSSTAATRHKLDGLGKSVISVGWSPDAQAIAWGNRTDKATSDYGGILERTFCLRNLDFGPPPDAKTFIRAQPKLGSLRMGFKKSDPLDLRTIYFAENNRLRASLTIPQPYDQIRCYTLLPNMECALGTNEGAYVVGIDGGKLRLKLSDRGEELWGMAPSPGWKYLATAGNDQILRVWKLETGEMLLSLFVAGDEWIAWTQEGYYAASLAGERLMGWHVNRGPAEMADFYPASHFHKSLYRPDVIRRLLESGNLRHTLEIANRELEQQQRVIRVQDVLPARVSIETPGAQTEQSEGPLTVRATAEPLSKNPVTSMRLIINGRPYGAAKSIGPAPAPDGVAADGPPPKATAEWKVDLPPGKYNVAVKAETADSYALSPPVEVNQGAKRPDGTAAEPPSNAPSSNVPAAPKLHVLAIEGSPAGGAAAAAAAAVKANAGSAYSDVEVKVLPAGQATPAAVAAELGQLKNQSGLQDTTIIYYAGQETIDTGGNYRLAAAPPGQPEAAGTWLNDKELKRDLSQIRGRLMLVVDATRKEQQSLEQESVEGFCCSASSANGGSRLDTAAADFLRELLTEDYGVIVMRGSRKSAEAAASSSPGGARSPFSQAFTEALSGQADEDRDGTLLLPEAARYLQQRVRELSGGKQSPVVERPPGVPSFPLAKPPQANPAPQASPAVPTPAEPTK